MSRAPWVVPKPEAGLPRGPQTMHDTALGWRLVNPRMAERYSTESMGETAENVAERYGVTREEQDAFALQSHPRAVAAARRGRFADEIVPVEAPARRRRGEPVTVEADEGPRADTSLEKLGRLRPAFREGGTVTAGNASTLNDGAACLVLASARASRGARRRARWRGSSRSASPASTPPTWGSARSPAIRRALDAAGPDARRHRPGRDQRGVRRPGARLRRRARDRRGAAERQRRRDRARPPARLLRARASLTTLVWELRRRGARYGIAALCVGVGQGVATVVENPEAAANRGAAGRRDSDSLGPR